MPIFPRERDDAEAVCLAMEIALDYRQQFGTDVFIDLLGYRRHGHNEGDEPKVHPASATRPSPSTPIRAR